MQGEDLCSQRTLDKAAAAAAGADANSAVPSEWEESDPRVVANSAEVRLRSFSTKVHKARGGAALSRPTVDAPTEY